MSFPTIPNICPDICINRDDAINILLVSIALEEISLADLIDAEVKKIRHVVDYDENKHDVSDIKDINRSVDQTLKDIIKLQMLLQFKLENVQELICPCTTTTSTSTSTTTTTTTTTTMSTTTKTTTTTATTTTTTKTCTITKTSTTKSTTSTKTTTTAKEKCKCCLKGIAHGYVSKKCDFFFGGIAAINANVCRDRCCLQENLLHYYIQKDTVMESIKAFPYSLKTECLSTKFSCEIKITGKCSIVRKTCSKNDIIDKGSFEFIVCDTFWTKNFRMVIIADNNPNLNHDSGKTAINFSGLYIEQ